MSSIKLKTAVLGLGNMGRHHARNHYEIPGIELCALCDANEERVNQYAEQFGVRAYTDVDSLLDNEDIDAVSIVVPTQYHYEVAKKVISRGIHLLIEKPIADSVEKADELTAFAKENNCTLMVGHIERFNPAIIALKKFIDEGRLGEIVSLISRRVGMFPNQIKDANVMIDLAVHDIDIFSYLLGGKTPTSLRKSSGRALVKDRDDYADIFIEYGTGVSGLIQVNWITPYRVRSLSITGSKGCVELDYMAQKVVFYKTEFTEDENSVILKESCAEQLKIEKVESLRAELLHFIDCIHRNKEPLINGQSGREALSLALGNL